MAIQNTTMDEVILELARTMKALKALKSTRKGPVMCLEHTCDRYHKTFASDGSGRCKCGHVLFPAFSEVKQHAAVKRASMDLSRTLADLRQGR